MTDDDDFIRLGLARARDQRLRKTIEAGIYIGPAAEQIIMGEYPVVQQLLHAPASARPPEQTKKGGNAGHQANRAGDDPFEPEHRSQHIGKEPSADREQDQRQDGK